ncbi:MAG TPA: hypothetical protein VIJ66_01240 [Solirubrobacteraceae bacterium]
MGPYGKPGLAREIVDQWKAETAHRHRTIDGLREIDHESMRSYYKGEHDLSPEALERTLREATVYPRSGGEGC